MARLVLVDDTDSNFQYTGDWSLIDGADYARQGNFGAPYRSSLHRTTAGGASFSYTYDGSSGKIYGTINVKTTNGVTDPTWECKVDNTIISLETPFRYTENNWVLCKWDENTVPSGRHTVTVTAKSNSQAFLFDYFLYKPSPGGNVQNAEILVPFNNPDIKYGSGWTNLGTDATMAPDGGAVMTFSFYGTGITWVGTIPRELPQGSTSAEYSIDGQTTTFQLVGNPGGTTQYFQKYFQVSGLQQRSHTLQVTSRGRTSLTPLVLQNVIIQGGSLQESKDTGLNGNTDGSNGNSGNNGNNGSSGNTGGSTSISSSTIISSNSRSSTTTSSGTKTSVVVTVVTQTDSSGSTLIATITPSTTNVAGKTIDSDATVNQTSGSGSGTSIGPIIGGVVGGVLVILLILALLFYRRRRASRSASIQEYLDQGQVKFGYTERAQPFYTDSATGATSTHHEAGGARSEPTAASGSASEGPHGQQQMVQTGTSSVYPHPGLTSKRAQNFSASSSGPYSATDTNFYGSPSSSSGLGQYSNARPTSSTSAHTGSVAGSTDQLLLSSGQPASKFREAFGYGEPLAQEQQYHGPSQACDMVITHEDSGYRMPQHSSPPTGVIEYPPMYTPS